MTIDNINDGVGRKIVEALKMQSADFSEGEVFADEEDTDADFTEGLEPASEMTENYMPGDNTEMNFGADYSAPSYEQPMNSTFGMQNPMPEVHTVSQSFVDNAFNQSITKTLGIRNTVQIPATDDFEYPGNVAVLKQLIAKLPAGVSRQTGALIIRQTMEALGIPMQNVLQEASAVRESFAANANECRSNIVEYRKQIGILENKVQQYQQQIAVLNDIIGLFVQTGR